MLSFYVPYSSSINTSARYIDFVANLKWAMPLTNWPSRREQFFSSMDTGKHWPLGHWTRCTEDSGHFDLVELSNQAV